MQTEPPKADPPKRKRRWFQFSMRSLMIFMLICAIASAWVGWKIEQNPLLAFVNVFLVASAFLLPTAFGLLLARLHRRLTS